MAARLANEQRRSRQPESGNRQAEQEWRWTQPGLFADRSGNQCRDGNGTVPSRRAAVAPSTTAGYRAVAGLSHAPEATDAPTVDSRSSWAAVTAMPPVWAGGIRSVR